MTLNLRQRLFLDEHFCTIFASACNVKVIILCWPSGTYWAVYLFCSSDRQHGQTSLFFSPTDGQQRLYACVGPWNCAVFVILSHHNWVDVGEVATSQSEPQGYWDGLPNGAQGNTCAQAPAQHPPSERGAPTLPYFKVGEALL